MRERCSTLIGFVREFWTILEPKAPLRIGWAVEAVALHLEAVSDGRVQYLLINVPPGMMKSLLVAVFWPAWEWATRDASLRFLSSSFSRPNVIRDNSKMRKLVESDKYRTLFPQVQLDPTSNAKDKFENLDTGNREGRAFESMTGGRGDRVLIDDPHSVDSAESDTQREGVVQTFNEAIPDRLNDMTKSAIVVIMQRLHAKDVAGVILANGLPYCHLNLPMEFETTREVGGVKTDARCVTHDDNGVELFRDPRKHEGELLFPERFPPDVVAGLKRQKGTYAYAGQYQQRPTAREGGLFKRAWFAGKIIDRAELPAGHLTRCRAWDFAATEEGSAADSDPDWTAGLRLARNGTDYYIEGIERDRLSPGMVQRLVEVTAQTDPVGTTVRLPIDPGQAGVYQARGYVKALAGFPVKLERPRGDKVTRALPSSIQAEFGHLYLVNSGPPELGVDPWIATFLDELCAFPKAAHDDQVDALSDAFNELAIGGVIPFESESAGHRETIAVVERDRRYQFRDIEPAQAGNGFGSVPSSSQGFAF
jgi:predicted phage terminase large subunit-like protein